MVTYKQLEKEFERKVKDLQAKCRHKRLSPWIERCWAPGHYSNVVFKECIYCHKVIKEENLVENYRKRLIKNGKEE